MTHAAQSAVRLTTLDGARFDVDDIEHHAFRACVPRSCTRIDRSNNMERNNNAIAATQDVNVVMGDGSTKQGKQISRTDAWKVDTQRGTSKMALSSQWMRRPDDERFLNLFDLRDAVKARADSSWWDIVNVNDVRVIAERDDPAALRLVVPRNKGDDAVTEPNHWAFGQMCSLLRIPASYVRELPAAIAGINMQYALANFRQEAIKAYVYENGRTELRAANGPDYGRVFDHQIVDAVIRIAGNGIGDTHWKVPGVMDWGTMLYDPLAPVTKRSTTLFASDRDVFLFLVDDTHPIEIGKLPDGSPDYIFRGFYVWNSEVGSKSLGVATFYMRAICCNRIMWGVEGYQEITLRHTKNAPIRFADEVRPALESFADMNTSALLSGIKAAREAVVAHNKDEQTKWLDKQGFTKPQTKQIIDAVLREEGREPESVWDFVQGITAVARDIPHQDARIAYEHRAGKLLDKVTKTTDRQLIVA